MIDGATVGTVSRDGTGTVAASPPDGWYGVVVTIKAWGGGGGGGRGSSQSYCKAGAGGFAQADYLAKTWDRPGMEKALEFASEKAISTGQKIDVALSVIRNAFMHMDLPLAKEYLDKAEKLVAKGGDWDRRNRLRVFTATYCMCTREMKKAAELFLESVATFTSTGSKRRLSPSSSTALRMPAAASSADSSKSDLPISRPIALKIV